MNAAALQQVTVLQTETQNSFYGLIPGQPTRAILRCTTYSPCWDISVFISYWFSAFITNKKKLNWNAACEVSSTQRTQNVYITWNIM